MKLGTGTKSLFHDIAYEKQREIDLVADALKVI